MKPLTKAEREYISKLGPEHDESHFALALGYAMDAEAFWRSAVKNASAIGGTDYFCCKFCDQYEHRKDCPWAIANSEK